MEVITFILVFLLTACSNSNGNIGAAFYNFDNFTLIDFSQYQDKLMDYHPNVFITERLDDMIFNFGLPITWLGEESIALFQYVGDKTYYSISPAKNWDTSEVGDNITFDNYYSVILTLPRSKQTIGPYHENPQLIMSFTCSYVYDTLYSEVTFTSPFSYNLKMFSGSKSDCLQVFSVVSYVFLCCKYFFITLFIIFGIILAFSGLKYLRISLFICTFLVIFLLMIILFNWSIDPSDSSLINSSLKSILITAGIVSIVISFISIKCDCIGILCLGIAFGACISLILYNTLFHSLFSHRVLYWVSGIIGLIGGIFACKINPIVIIFSTPLVGSYLIVHSIGTLIGGFPNESIVYTRIKAGLGFQYTFYAYLAAILILGFIGLLFQVRNISENERNNDQEKGLNSESAQFVFVRYVAIIRQN